MSTTPKEAQGLCPRLEEIAALIDGRLGGRQHEEIAAHLGECAVCYEIFAATLRFQLEEEPAPKPQVVPHPALLVRRPARLVGAVAVVAALLVAVVLVPRLTDLGGGFDADLPAGKLVAGIARGHTAATVVANTYSGDEWFRTRGGAVGMSAGSQSFRLGVRTVDLEAAIRAGEAEQTERLLGELMEAATDLPPPEMVRFSYENLFRRVRQGEPTTALAEGSAHVDRLLTERAHDPLYAFGKWAEAGLLASRVGSVNVLTSRAFQSFPSRLEQQELPEEIEHSLDRIRSLLKEPVSEETMVEMEEAFLVLVSRGGNL